MCPILQVIVDPTDLPNMGTIVPAVAFENFVVVDERRRRVAKYKCRQKGLAQLGVAMGCWDKKVK